MCPYFRAATSLWPLHVQLQAGLLSRQASQTTNTPATCRSIASWKTAKLSLAQFDYVVWEESWWSHTENQPLDTWFNVHKYNPSTNNDKLEHLYKHSWSDLTLALVLHLKYLSYSQRHLLGGKCSFTPNYILTMFYMGWLVLFQI